MRTIYKQLVQRLSGCCGAYEVHIPVAPVPDHLDSYDKKDIQKPSDGLPFQRVSSVVQTVLRQPDTWLFRPAALAALQRTATSRLARLLVSD